MKNYFENCSTIDEAKKEYYNLAKVHHPDKGGDTATFQEILNQFEKFKPGQEKYKGEADQFNGKEYADIIAQLIKIPLITVELCGSWIWISGETKPVKDQIKGVNTGESYKCGFSGKKSMWYFSPTGYRKRSKKEFHIDEIRNLFGSKKVEKDERNKIAA